MAKRVGCACGCVRGSEFRAKCGAWVCACVGVIRVCRCCCAWAAVLLVLLVGAAGCATAAEATSARVSAPQTFDLGSGVKLEMVWVPAGSFMMGSPDSEEGCRYDETQHHVTLTQGFWLGKYEVTQGQWEAVMGSNPSHFKGKDLPVETVSWDDCQEFIKKLNARFASEGGGFRLPTEAEWEYACRAGTTTPFHYGESLDSSMANLTDNYPYDGRDKGEYPKRTVPVGQFEPNAWGLYDMHGNVWEWCEDRYGDYPSGGVVDPQGTAGGSCRVFRGGSWGICTWFCRSATRAGNFPGRRFSDRGFRLARTQPPFP